MSNNQILKDSLLASYREVKDKIRGGLERRASKLPKEEFESTLNFVTATAFREKYSKDKDPLTGLLNREAFEALTLSGLKWIERHGGKLAVLYVDANGFKLVNDTYGHDKGDEAIQLIGGAVGKAFGDSVRTSDIISRLMGDEFGLTLLIKDPVDENLGRISERINEKFSAALAANNFVMPITLSYGAAVIEGNEVDKDERRMKIQLGQLVKQSEVAMYNSKSAKIAGVTLWQEGMVMPPKEALSR